MEVAGQWRREWAGTAEFGKVTEGGVTRQVARAMEVLHASAPGTRMRVMRAAYHSTAGPGVPASSFMLHSSRRVISSVFNLLESPSITTYPSKPLEISSTPLEPFPDLNTETENYKVTEPDDTEISEPSKWRVAQNGSKLRMLSEESSSTDNASIIDLDSRSPHRSIFRKYSYDSENSDVLSSKKSSARASPLLDAPVTLSTLKYKSLLNSSNDWNNRRKSYSFEDTCPTNETIIHSNDILAMESSTDSGICKSTEIVNDQADDNNYFSSFETTHRNTNIHDETFKDWLHKNRPNTAFKGAQHKPWRQHETLIEDPTENKISLKSPGKVCITVPITIEKDDIRTTNEENDRRVKKVEFCKTELHFAAESGRVNIIATDEKPPPSNDFRKRKSAFVPIADKFEKPVTLFGERGETSESIKTNDFSIYGNSDITEDEIENTAATKSILKNKIPKPKPYLLGENTVLGTSDNIYEIGRPKESSVASGVSLINKQLQAENKYSTAKISTFSSEVDTDYKNNQVRTMNKGPAKTNSPVEKTEKNKLDQRLGSETATINSVKKKIHSLPMSPVAKPKTRQLRESDLMYFGIDNERNHSVKDKTKCTESILSTDTNVTDNIFQSVKLIKRISNSACNSEAESEDGPEYQNIILRANLSQPTPKPRSKYNTATDIPSERVLQPIVEQHGDYNKLIQESRRSRTKKYEEVVVPTPRSRSEPAKRHILQEDKSTPRDYTPTNSMKQNSPSPRSKKYQYIEQRRRKPSPIKRELHKSSISEDEAPLYVNLKTKTETNRKQRTQSDWNRPKSIRQDVIQAEAKVSSNKTKRLVQEPIMQHIRRSPDKTSSNISKQSLHKEDSLERRQSSVKKTNNIKRTKKLVTPENSFCDQTTKETSNTIVVNEYNDIDNKNAAVIIKPKQRNHSSHIKPTDEKYAGLKQSSLMTDKEKHATKHSKHTSKEHSDSSKDTHKIYGHAINGDCKTINSVEHRNHLDTHSKKATHRTPKRSEYVINYDDKNGTVSSICKIKPHSQSKRKPVVKENNSKEIRHKTLDKTPLLQLPEQQWNRNGLTQEKTKWKIKNRVQRSCQLL